MNNQLNDIAYYIQFRDKIKLDVSKAPVAWHIDHSLKVINRVIRILKVSDTSIHQKRYNFLLYVFFLFNYLPRGQGKTPSSVMPPDPIKTEDLLKQLKAARKNLEDFEELEDQVNFLHPFFGHLNKKQAYQFIKIHTHHHLKIIKDIVRVKNS